MRLIKLILIISLIFSFISVGAIAQSDSWKEKSNDSFVIEYKEGYKSDTDKVLNWMNETRLGVRSSVPSNVKLEEKVYIRIYPESQWRRSEGTMYWESTDPVRIHILAPSKNSNGEIWHRKNLAHEYLNIVFWDHAEDNADYSYWQRNPSWFAEGLSEYYAYHNISKDIKQTTPPRGVKNKKEIIRNGDGYFDIIASDRYDGGHIISHYMLETYKEKSVLSVLSQDTDSFPNAVERSLGVSYKNFKNKWLEWAEKNVGGDYSYNTSSGDNTELKNKLENLKSLLEQKNKTIQNLKNNTVNINVYISTKGNKSGFYRGDNAYIDVSSNNTNIDMKQININYNNRDYSPNKSGSVSIKLNSTGRQNLSIFYRNQSKNVSINVKKPSIKNQYDQDNNGEIDGDEVRNAIQCFLFGGNSCIDDELSGDQTRTIIQEFLFG